eukprot:TRINITY_DN28900_c0_g1_i1.p1 TRINITY_DN28900_c0_g1~~TRINITY_DN28900_c0_g1_i1.p1  ORF type:complete len:724 (+),score=96.07 TRINITY_DN28900_c0_g1_i1:239-2410(+)
MQEHNQMTVRQATLVRQSPRSWLPGGVTISCAQWENDDTTDATTGAPWRDSSAPDMVLSDGISFQRYSLQGGIAGEPQETMLLDATCPGHQIVDFHFVQNPSANSCSSLALFALLAPIPLASTFVQSASTETTRYEIPSVLMALPQTRSSAADVALVPPSPRILVWAQWPAHRRDRRRADGRAEAAELGAAAAAVGTWGGGSSAVIAAAGNASVSSHGLPPTLHVVDASWQHFQSIACAFADKSRLCAASIDGSVSLVNGNGQVLVSKDRMMEQPPVSIASSSDLWAILSFKGVALLLTAATLELIQVVELGQLRIHHALRPASCNPFASEVAAAGRTALSRGEEFLVVASSSRASTSSVAELVLLDVSVDTPCVTHSLPGGSLSGEVEVTCAAALAGAAFERGTAGEHGVSMNETTVCIGFSDGSFRVFRNDGGSGYQLCGRHRLGEELTLSPLVFCGFATWQTCEGSPQIALIATTRSGIRRLWITPGPESAATGIAVRARQAQRSLNQSQSAQRRSSELPLMQPLASSRNMETDEENASMARPRPEPQPMPQPEVVCMPVTPSFGETLPLADCDTSVREPRSELERLIGEIADRIHTLEDEEASLIGRNRRSQELERLPEASDLVSLEVPAARELARVPKERRVDPKWAEAQRCLIDPVSLSRAYLDRTCRPRAVARQPFWLAPGDVDMGNVSAVLAETTAEDFSPDPIDRHVLNLCQRW